MVKRINGCMGMNGVASKGQYIVTKIPLLIVLHGMFGLFRVKL